MGLHVLDGQQVACVDMRSHEMTKSLSGVACTLPHLHSLPQNWVGTMQVPCRQLRVAWAPQRARLYTYWQARISRASCSVARLVIPPTHPLKGMRHIPLHLFPTQPTPPPISW